MISHGAINIAYDGDGNRVSETAGGVTTKYLVDTLNPTHLPQVFDEIVNGGVSRTYAYGLQRISENQQLSNAWTPSYYGYDGHGNVRFLTNSAGGITDTYQYDAFGALIASTGTTPNNYYYSGEWLDGSVGLYYLRARYYNQATARFWTRDPVEGVQCCGMTWNPYIYVLNDPVDQIDPTGRGLVDQALLISTAFWQLVAVPAITNTGQVVIVYAPFVAKLGWDTLKAWCQEYAMFRTVMFLTDTSVPQPKPLVGFCAAVLWLPW